jgi:ferredoxin
MGLEDRKPFQRTPRLAPRVDADKCVACGTCEEVCPVGAISVEDIARVDPAICLGCGLCVDECTQGALSLDPPGTVRKKTLEGMG